VYLDQNIIAAKKRPKVDTLRGISSVISIWEHNVFDRDI